MCIFAIKSLGSSFSLLFYVESRFGWPNGSEINRRLVIYEVSCTFSISRVSMHVPTIPRDCSLTGIKVEYEKSRARFFARWITRCVKRIPSYTIFIYEKSRLKRWWRCRGTIVGDLVYIDAFFFNSYLDFFDFRIFHQLLAWSKFFMKFSNIPFHLSLISQRITFSSRTRSSVQFFQ